MLGGTYVVYPGQPSPPTNTHSSQVDVHFSEGNPAHPSPDNVSPHVLGFVIVDTCWVHSGLAMPTSIALALE